MAQLFALFGTTQVQWIVTLIAIDVVLGIAAALAKKNFCLGKLANFMIKPILGYVLGFAVLEIVASVLPALVMVTTVAYFLILLALIGSILSNLAKFGLPIPAYLKKG